MAGAQRVEKAGLQTPLLEDTWAQEPYPQPC